MRISTSDAHIPSSSDLQDAYARWLFAQNIRHPQDENFRRFLDETKRKIYGLCPHTLMRTSTFSFGGADGGGAILETGAQGEDVEYVHERVRHLTSVHPFSEDDFYDTFHRRVAQMCPDDAIIGEEPTSSGIVVFTEDKAQKAVHEGVALKPFLQRNTAEVRTFDERRWNILQEQRHAGMYLWSLLTKVIHSQNTPKSLAPSFAAA